MEQVVLCLIKTPGDLLVERTEEFFTVDTGSDKIHPGFMEAKGLIY